MNKKSTLRWKDEKTCAQAASFLTNRKVLLTTSDTVIGLLAEASKSGAQALNQIKKRTKKPYIVLTGSMEDVQKFARVPSQAVFHIMQACWPGPLTIILPALNKTDTPDGTIAIRIPAHGGLQKLLEHVTGLFSTSANISGNPVPQGMKDVDQSIIDQVACIILDEQDQNKLDNLLPSTIIQATGPDIVLVREGAYPVDKIEKIYGKKLKPVAS